MGILISMVVAGVCAGIHTGSFVVGIGVSAAIYALMPYRYGVN